MTTDDPIRRAFARDVDQIIPEAPPARPAARVRGERGQPGHRLLPRRRERCAGAGVCAIDAAPGVARGVLSGGDVQEGVEDSAMTERPILFDGESVRAILAGHKWQTRRVVKPTQSTPKVAPLHMEPWIIGDEWQTDDAGLPCWAGFHPDYPGEAKWFSCPYGAAGDRLWVRETWALVPATAYRASPVQQTICPTDSHDAAIYKAGWSLSAPTRWRSPIHMPRWAARILLTVTGVRVERLQAISEADAEAEGIDVMPSAPAALNHRTSYARRWDAINGKCAPWSSDPWVWVLSFEVVR